MNSDQILNTKVGSAGPHEDERIGSRQIGPACRQKAHASVPVAVIDTLLAPLPTVGDQLQCLPTKRMVGMGYTETWGRIGRLKCIRLWIPCNRRACTGSPCITSWRASSRS